MFTVLLIYSMAVLGRKLMIFWVFTITVNGSLIFRSRLLVVCSSSAPVFFYQCLSFLPMCIVKAADDLAVESSRSLPDIALFLLHLAVTMEWVKNILYYNQTTRECSHNKTTRVVKTFSNWNILEPFILYTLVHHTDGQTTVYTTLA